MILLFLIPTFMAVLMDKDGDKHPNYDLIVIGYFMLYHSFVTCFVIHKYQYDLFIPATLHQIGLFIFVFPYLVNYVHFKRKVTSDPKWWDHLSKSAVPDKWPIWYKRHWITRMVIAFLIGLGFSLPYYL